MSVLPVTHHSDGGHSGRRRFRDLVIDIYARTLVIHNYADKPAQGFASVRAAQRMLLARLPWIQAVVVKTRNSQDPQQRRGSLVYGETVDRKILENGSWYAIDPMR